MDKEVILAIEEYDKDGYFGYEIHTNKQIIQLLMSSEQQCCENFGCFLSEDDFVQFIGAELRDIYLTDTSLKTIDIELDKILAEAIYESNIIFVNLDTSKGVLQFVAYNYHNGYYGHDVYIRSEQLLHDDIL